MPTTSMEKMTGLLVMETHLLCAQTEGHQVGEDLRQYVGEGNIAALYSATHSSQLGSQVFSTISCWGLVVFIVARHWWGQAKLGPQSISYAILYLGLVLLDQINHDDEPPVVPVEGLDGETPEPGPSQSPHSLKVRGRTLRGSWGHKAIRPAGESSCSSQAHGQA